MSLPLRIISFIAFLVAYGGWLWTGAKLLPVWQNRVLKGKAFWYTQLQALIEVAAIFVFIWLLSGFFDIKLVLAWLIAVEIAYCLNAILGKLFVSSDSAPGAAGTVAGAELDIGHPSFTIWLVLMLALPVLIFPIVAGVFHFAVSDSADLAKAAVRCTMLFYLWYLMVTQIVVVYTLANVNIDESSRLAVLMARLTALIPTGLSLAVLLWSFDALGDESELSLGALSLAVSPIVGAGLLAFFLLGALLPYAIGVRRAKEKRQGVLEHQREWIRQLREAMQFGGTARFSVELDRVGDSLTREMARVEETEPLLAVVIATEPPVSDSDPIDDALLLQTMGGTTLASMPSASSGRPMGEPVSELAPVIAQAYERYRSQYLPTRYYSWLEELSTEVDDIQQSLGTRRPSAASRRETDSWVAVLQDRGETLDKELHEEKHSRALVVVAAAGLGSATVSAFMSEFGNWAWTQVVGGSG